MPEHTESPFAAYLRDVDALLADLPAEQRAAIRRELAAHLADAAAEQDASPDDPAFHELVIAQLGPSDQVALAFADVHGGLSRRVRKFALFIGMVGGMLGTLGAFAYVARGTVGIMLAFGLALAGLAGMIGATRLGSGRNGGLPLICSSALALLMAGFPIFYDQQHSLDTLFGSWLLIGGELLFVSGAVAARNIRLPYLNKRVLIGFVLLLVSFVSPFSYFPNPLGLYYIFFGVYRFNPNLPFVNHFATQGVEHGTLVSHKLDQLIGQTGLDPLDPVHPLVGYRIVSETAASLLVRASVDVELRYADGSTRQSTIEVTSFGPRATYTSIDTVFAPHVELPGLPFADASAPFHFDKMERLPIDALAAWGSMPMWSPDGQRFLYFAEKPTEFGDTLWVADIASGEATHIAANVRSPLWSADSRNVVYVDPSRFTTTYVKSQAQATNELPYKRIFMRSIADGRDRLLATTDWNRIAMVRDHVYFVRDSLLWRVAIGGGWEQELRPLPEAGPLHDQGNGDDQTPIAVDSSGQHVAYRCGNDLCVAGTTGTQFTRISLGFSQPNVDIMPPLPDATPGPVPTALPAEYEPPQFGSLGLAWSPDGQKLAAIVGAWDYGTKQIPPVLRIVTPEGQVEQSMELGPNGLTEAPQWTPDGRTLLIDTMPEHGRRIVAVDVAARRVADLSQPRWDAFAQLSADGRHALIWNGRGGVWIADAASR